MVVFVVPGCVHAVYTCVYPHGCADFSKEELKSAYWTGKWKFLFLPPKMKISLSPRHRMDEMSTWSQRFFTWLNGPVCCFCIIHDRFQDFRAWHSRQGKTKDIDQMGTRFIRIYVVHPFSIFKKIILLTHVSNMSFAQKSYCGVTVHFVDILTTAFADGGLLLNAQPSQMALWGVM